MFKPKKIYYEENITNYELGNFLLNKYSDIPKEVILSHNNIPSLRNNSNKEFLNMKNYLIIGTRKTHKYVPNHKVSDFLVPFTLSGCMDMCMIAKMLNVIL